MQINKTITDLSVHPLFQLFITNRYSQMCLSAASMWHVNSTEDCVSSVVANDTRSRVKNSPMRLGSRAGTVQLLVEFKVKRAGARYNHVV